MGLLVYMGVSKLAVPFWDLNNKDHSILGSILGSPYFGKLPYSDHYTGFLRYVGGRKLLGASIYKESYNHSGTSTLNQKS